MRHATGFYTLNPIIMRKRTIWLVLSVIIVGIVGYAINGPYFYPTTVALGTCHYDWTSPTSYSSRASPMETVTFTVGEAEVRVCYSRPSARGRTIYGENEGLVRYGRYWRTGANEPAMIFTNKPLRIGDVAVPAGRYSLYTFPGREAWEVVVNESTFHWGVPYTRGLEAQEVGRTTVPVDSLNQFVEQFRMQAVEESGTHLELAWGDISVRVPLQEGDE